MKEKIKIILKSLRQYKKYAIITPIFMICEALLECILPFTMSVFVDVIGQVHSIDDFTTFYTHPKLPFKVSMLLLIIVLVSITLLSLLFGILGGKTAAKASVGLSTNLSSDLYKKIMSFSFENIDRFSTSSLITRLTTDVGNVRMSFQMMIRIVVRAPLMLIFSTVMAFVSGGTMAFIFISLIPLLAIGLYFIVRGAMGVFTKVFKRYDKLNQSVQENVSAIRVVKSFVREEFEKEKFNNASDSITTEFVKGEKIVALNNPLMNTTIHLSNILVLGIGATVISKTASVDSLGIIQYTKLSIGQLSSLLTYGIQILTSLNMISMIMVMLVMSLESIRRIGEVLLEEPTIKDCENPIFDINDGSIEFRNVNFKYAKTAEKNTLSNINIKIKSGEFVGIIGSTGSGKSSVVNLISRLYDATEGEVIVSGHNVKEYDPKTLRDKVAVVLQKNVVFTGTISENLRWGDINAKDEELVRACQISQATEFIDRLPNKYETMVYQGGTNVSGGQKQRLCIARAILKKPKILILDDSTSAVDTKTDKLIRVGLKEDLPEMTKIVIAQRISSIEDADQIIVMEDGHINEIGTHESLLKSNKIYQEVYYTQNRVGGDDHASSN